MRFALPGDENGASHAWHEVSMLKSSVLTYEKMKVAIAKPKDPSKTSPYKVYEKMYRHAVAIIAETESCWVIKNSWGQTWGSHGLGLIEKNDDLYKLMDMEFIDCCWTIASLKSVNNEVDMWEGLSPSAQNSFLSSRRQSYIKFFEGKGLPPLKNVQQ